MKEVRLILERSNSEWYGRVEDIGDFMPVSYGESIVDVETGIRGLIKDHQEHDDPDEWSNIHVDSIHFVHCYDLTALFDRFDVLKISSVAKIAGMNPSLLRQYVSGKKFPGPGQATRIERAVKKIAEELAKSVVKV